MNPQDESIGTVVGANVRLQGTLKDTNEITVYGTVEGEVISSKDIIVSESAVIKGPVIGENVIVSGNIKGSVEAKQKLEIQESGNINGSIIAQTLVINAGAIFNGKSSMGKESEKKVVDDKEKIESFEKKEEKNDQEFELE